MVELLRIGTAVPFLAQGADQDDNGDERRSDQDHPYNGDLHCFFPHSTVALQFFSGQRNPSRLPSNMLVLTKLGSIQKRHPHSGHLNRHRRSISASLLHRSSLLARSINLLKASIPEGPRTKS